MDLINLAIINRYTYERWKTVVNIMILKDPGDIRIHHLWLIHLYKHDYTMIKAIKWRKSLVRSEEKGLLHPH